VVNTILHVRSACVPLAPDMQLTYLGVCCVLARAGDVGMLKRKSLAATLHNVTPGARQGPMVAERERREVSSRDAQRGAGLPRDEHRLLSAKKVVGPCAYG